MLCYVTVLYVILCYIMLHVQTGVCAYLDTYICTCIYVLLHIHMYIYISIYIYIHIYIYIYMYIYICMYKHMYHMHRYVYVSLSTYIYIYTCICICICICICMRIYGLRYPRFKERLRSNLGSWSLGSPRCNLYRLYRFVPGPMRVSKIQHPICPICCCLKRTKI